MPKICYQDHRFDAGSQAIVAKAVEIVEAYAKQGYDLTLRQLYYQFVSKALIRNKDTEYKRLGSIINDARLAGLIDWNHITDRTRNMRQNAHWESPADIIQACASQFQIDKWASQDNYIEVWIEKDALVGVLEVACKPLDAPYFSCRGYTSQSEMWTAAMRLVSKIRHDKAVHIIHLGDHDPSGIDMSRDIEDRLNLFVRHHCPSNLVNVHRIALNMDQIRQYGPPPNPAKVTDSRAAKYIEEYGDESWELDALEPDVLTKLIQDKVAELQDEGAWDKACVVEDEYRRQLAACSDKWEEIAEEL